MTSQVRLIEEEQDILDGVIEQLDDAMIKENKALTKEILEQKRIKDKCLPETYGDLVKSLNDEEIANLNLRRAMKIREELYDTRLVLELREKENSNSKSPETIDLKVGLHTYYQKEKIIVISWIRPVCRHYLLDNSSVKYEEINEGKYGEKYHTYYELKLKRNIDVFFDKVKEVTHIFPVAQGEYEEIIADEFLQELLSRRSEIEFRNIVFSIQKKQGEIIQTPFRKNLIVQGCAGSGKSMIMLHRLPILLYDNPKDLKKNNIYIITPSTTYIQMAQRLLIELEISDLELGTLDQYYLHLLERYNQNTKEYRKAARRKKIEPSKEGEIYSKDCVKEITRTVRSFMVAGEVDHKPAYDMLGADYKESHDNRPMNIIREESVRLQEILNVNGRNLRSYFDSLAKLVEELNNVGRMLENRKIAVLRNIDKRISSAETDLAKAQKELDSIDRTEHQRMYNNREITIRICSDSLKQYRKEKKAVKAQEHYFDELREVASTVRNLTSLFRVTSKDIDRPTADLMYRAETLRDVFINESADLVEELREIKDPYAELAGSLSEAAESLISHIEELKSIEEPVLKHNYFKKLEKRSAYLHLLGKHIAEDVYETILANHRIEKDVKKRKNDKGEIEEFEEYPIFTFTPYLKLQILQILQGAPLSRGEALIAIDEAQNIAPEEFRLINTVNNGRTIFNLYGDVRQHVEGTKGLDSWDEIDDIADFDIQKMNENYRNARQITQYCNNRFHIDMQAINLDGDGVHEIEDEITFKEKLDQLFHSPLKPGISSIIVKNEREAMFLKESAKSLSGRMNNITANPSSLLPNKWNVLTIDQAKGLEFETVIAVSGRMTENEKYIAFTRALNELYIYDQEVQLPKNSSKTNKTTKNTSVTNELSKTEEKQKRDKKEAPKVVPKVEESEEVDKIPLKEFFESAGLKTVDLRKKGGPLWVVGNKEKIGNTIEAATLEYKISGTYAMGKAIGYVEGWFTKSKK